MHTRQGDNQKIAGKILFYETHQEDTGLTKMLTMNAESVVEPKGDEKIQSLHTAPIVIFNDLKKTHGDTVSADIVSELHEMPIMADETAEGKEEDLTTSSFDLSICQYRKPVKAGGKMAQQRRGYNLKKVSRGAAIRYHNRLRDELSLYQLAGDRGSFGTRNARDRKSLILPSMSHPRFNKVMVNPIKPPTHDRAMYAGQAKRISEITSVDVLDFNSLKNESEKLESDSNPLLPIKLYDGDKPMATEPFWLKLVTPAQWKDLQNNARDYNNMLANVSKRSSGFNHHLFKGDCLMVDNILVKKYKKPVRFYAGDKVRFHQSGAGENYDFDIVPNDVTVDRSITMGGQALAIAYGHTVPGVNFSIVDEEYDGKNKYRLFLEWMMGAAKVRFEDEDGYFSDFGVQTMDTYVRPVGQEGA